MTNKDKRILRINHYNNKIKLANLTYGVGETLNSAEGFGIRRDEGFNSMDEVIEDLTKFLNVFTEVRKAKSLGLESPIRSALTDNSVELPDIADAVDMPELTDETVLALVDIITEHPDGTENLEYVLPITVGSLKSLSTAKKNN